METPILFVEMVEDGEQGDEVRKVLEEVEAVRLNCPATVKPPKPQNVVYVAQP
jgi:hypothetical protein